MLGEIKKINFFQNKTEDGFSDSEYFKNAGKINFTLSGDLDGASIKFQVSFDNINWHYYVNGNEQFTLTKEGREIDIFENIPFYLRAELTSSQTNTDINLIGYYLDKFKEFGIIQQ